MTHQVLAAVTMPTTNVEKLKYLLDTLPVGLPSLSSMGLTSATEKGKHISYDARLCMELTCHI